MRLLKRASRFGTFGIYKYVNYVQVKMRLTYEIR